MTTYRFRLTREVTDYLKATVEITAEDLALHTREYLELHSNRAGGQTLDTPFDDLMPFQQGDVLEAAMGGDIEFDFSQCGDSGPIEISEVEVVSA